LRWNEVAMKRGSDMASIQGERALWLITLGLVEDAGRAFLRARALNAQAARHNTSLLYAGSLAAIDAGGAAGLRGFVRDNDLGNADAPAQLLQLANAALFAGDAAFAGEFVDRALASPALKPEDLASPWQASGGYSDLLVLATVLRARGDVAGADARLVELGALLDRMRDAGVQSHGMYFVRAGLDAMQGRPEQAMAALQRAVQLGWRDAWVAERQPFLESLRTRDDFRDVLAAVHARNAATAARLRTRLLAVESASVP
jgi:hypothetical protein